MGLNPQAKAFLAGMEASGAPPLYELSPEEARGATGMITELIGAGPEVAIVEDFRCDTTTGTSARAATCRRMPRRRSCGSTAAGG